MSNLMKDFNIRDILLKLRTFVYTREYNGETENISVELFPLNSVDMAAYIYNQRYGTLIADDIMTEYKNGNITATEIANILQTIHYADWKNLLEIMFADYNPLWNVDGLEKRTTALTHGEKIKYDKGVTVTNEQKTAGENTTEQLTNGTNEHQISPYDSTSYNPESKDIINNGKIKNTFNNGKVETISSGYDEDTHSGVDTTVDTYRRTGNIGVTMSTQLLGNGESFWSKFNFYDKFFKDINKDLTIGLWG